MGKLKNSIDYVKVDDSLEDLRFDGLLKKKTGKLKGFSASYGRNNKREEKENNENCYETDVEELSVDSSYEMLLNSIDSSYEMLLNGIDSSYEMFFNGLDHDQEEELKTDPQYKMFLENMKMDGDGKSFTVKIPISSDISEIICYEGKEEKSLENLYKKRKFKHDSKRVTSKVPRNSGAFSRKAKTGMLKTRNNSSEIENEGKNNKVGDVPGGERKNSDECCPDVEMFELNKIIHEGHCTPFVSSKSKCILADEENWDHINASSSSQFREKLMDFLKNPYDRQEFENLWKEVTCRRPVEGSKEIPGRVKQYSTKIKGKSYLDWYKELKMKIDEFRGEFRDDRRKILYLLRGFFFWLKNTGHEGAFQPWLDSSYLNALG